MRVWYSLVWHRPQRVLIIPQLQRNQCIAEFRMFLIFLLCQTHFSVLLYIILYYIIHMLYNSVLYICNSIIIHIIYNSVLYNSILYSLMILISTWSLKRILMSGIFIEDIFLRQVLKVANYCFKPFRLRCL